MCWQCAVPINGMTSHCGHCDCCQIEPIRGGWLILSIAVILVILLILA